MRARSVEVWMSDLERQMRASLKESLRFCMEAKVKQQIEYWVLSWPAQCVLLAMALSWCNGITAVFKVDDGPPSSSSSSCFPKSICRACEMEAFLTCNALSI